MLTLPQTPPRTSPCVDPPSDAPNRQILRFQIQNTCKYYCGLLFDLASEHSCCQQSVAVISLPVNHLPVCLSVRLSHTGIQSDKTKLGLRGRRYMTLVGIYQPLIGSVVQAFKWYQSPLPSITLNHHNAPLYHILPRYCRHDRLRIIH